MLVHQRVPYISLDIKGDPSLTGAFAFYVGLLDGLGMGLLG